MADLKEQTKAFDQAFDKLQLEESDSEEWNTDSDDTGNPCSLYILQSSDIKEGHQLAIAAPVARLRQV